MIGGFLQVCIPSLLETRAYMLKTGLEIQLRRPNKERYRLDHLLERKAKEGVKIYVIL